MSGNDTTLLERLKAAVWMVGNMDTAEDKAAWWHTFGPLWEEVANTGPAVQEWADREAMQRWTETQKGIT